MNLPETQDGAMSRGHSELGLVKDRDGHLL